MAVGLKYALTLTVTLFRWIVLLQHEYGHDVA